MILSIVASLLLCNRYREYRLNTALASSEKNVVIEEVTGEAFPPKILFSCWGKQPLLIRQAFSDTKGIWPQWEDIMELAADDAIGSDSARLITHVPGQLDSFELDLGPFDPDEIAVLNRKWTILVNDVDRYMPEMNDWINREFDFLPRWRRDDAQVSIATTGGGIGPHVDNYDVFLIQGGGKRQWKVGTEKIDTRQETEALIPDLSVRILGQDYDSIELVLEKGDLLYLPPRTIHWGTATTDDCITISVGMRAPSASELAARVAEAMAESIHDAVNRRYSETLMDTTIFPSLSMDVKESMKALTIQATNAILGDDDVWDEIVGRTLTEPKRYIENALVPFDEIGDKNFYREWGHTPEELLDRVVEGQSSLCLTEGISIATSVSGNDTLRFYANGDVWEISSSPATVQIFDALEHGKMLDNVILKDLDFATKDTLLELIDNGILYLKI